MLKYLFLLIFVVGCQTTDPTGNSIDITNTDFSDAENWKQSMACAIYVGPFGPFSDNSIVKAATKKGISKIKSVHHKFGTIILFSWDCTYVYGEQTEAGKDAERKDKERLESGFPGKVIK